MLKNVFPSFLSSLKVSKGAKTPTVNKMIIMPGYCPLLAHEKQFLAKLWAILLCLVHCSNLLLKKYAFLQNVEVEQGMTELSYHSGRWRCRCEGHFVTGNESILSVI